MDTLLEQWCLLFTYFTLCCSLFNAVSEGSQQEPQGRAQSDHHGVSHSSVRARSLVKEEEPAPPSAKV